MTLQLFSLVFLIMPEFRWSIKLCAAFADHRSVIQLDHLDCHSRSATWISVFMAYEL